MLPIVIRTTDEMLWLVPRELREGSYALGSRKARTIRTSCCRTRPPGIVSGALLAVARAAGETAPLLFTIGTVDRDQHWNLFNGPNTALSVQIFSNATSPFAARRTGPGAPRSRSSSIVFVAHRRSPGSSPRSSPAEQAA